MDTFAACFLCKEKRVNNVALDAHGSENQKPESSKIYLVLRFIYFVYNKWPICQKDSKWFKEYLLLYQGCVFHYPRS